MPRITLSDGRWVELRSMWISDKLRLIDLAAMQTTPIERLRTYAEVMEPAVREKSWDGSLLDMSEQQFLTALRDWGQAAEDDALPPASGRSSSEQSPSSASPRRTASRQGRTSR